MELRDLQYFAVVAEHQNMGRAAEALDLSATALSKCLRRLEKSVGAKLVQRTSKGVALTTVGTALLNRIGPLHGILKDVRREAADLAQGRAGHIRVGISMGANEDRLARAYVALLKESPALTLDVTVDDNSVLSKTLHKGELDFCIAAPRTFASAEFVFEHLYDVPMVVFASAHHRLAGRKQLSVADLVGERWATSNSTARSQWQALFQVFERNKLPLPVVALSANAPRLRTIAVAYSDYLGLTVRPILQQEMVSYPLVELPVKEFTHIHAMSIINRKGAYLPRAALRLIEILKTQAKEPAADGRLARMK
jgi:DNA-binding transcriptional LysR family regulator